MQKRRSGEVKPLAKDEAASTRQSWTQTSASDPWSLSHEPNAVSWEMPPFHLPKQSPLRPQPWPGETTLTSGGIARQETGSRAASCPRNGRKVLVIHHLGVGAGFTDSPCGEHSTTQIGITKLIPVKIIQLYFLPTIPNRKPVYLHI